MFVAQCLISPSIRLLTCTAPGDGAALTPRHRQPAPGRLQAVADDFQSHLFPVFTFTDAPYLLVLQNRVAVLQSLSGTGSLRLGAAFIAKFLPGVKVFVSNPTWGNHNNIFADAGVQVTPGIAVHMRKLSALSQMPCCSSAVVCVWE